MIDLFLKVEDQLTTLDECNSFLAIFSEFCCNERVDTCKDNVFEAESFLIRLQVYLPLVTVVHDKIIEVRKILDGIVDDGFKAVRKDG